MTLAGPVHEGPGVPLAATYRSPRPVEVSVRLAAAQRAMQRCVLARFAAAHYRRHGTVRAAAVRMGRREEWVRDLLVEAGVHRPRPKCGAAPRGALADALAERGAVARGR